MDSVKNRIMERIEAVLAPLKPNTVRTIARKRTFFALEAKLPAIHLVAGPERRIEEDTRGYTMEFPLDVKIMFSDERDPHGTEDKLVAAVQTKLEGDPQLSQLANWFKYDGDQPFVNDINKQDGGTIVQFTVQYRREKAKPEVQY